MIEPYCTRRRFLCSAAAAAGSGVASSAGRLSAEEAGANELLDRDDFAPLEEIFRTLDVRLAGTLNLAPVG